MKVAGTLSEWFCIKKGVRTGCNVSPCLFNILAEALMRKALDGYNTGFRFGGKIINNLRYADDIVLLATSPKELQQQMIRVEQAGTEFNMHINAIKTKVMTNTDCKVTVTVNGSVF